MATLSQIPRIPPDGGVFRVWSRFLRGTMTNDVTLTIPKIMAAPFLPVIARDRAKEVPYVMYPGTFVGLLNLRDHAALLATFGQYSPNLMVPAYSGTSYQVGYTAYDTAADDYGGTLDIDGNGGELVTAAGLGTATIAKVRPLGVVQEPIISRTYSLRHRNLNQQTQPNLLYAGQVVRIPVITDEEQDIFPGDRVKVSGASGNWDFLSNPLTCCPGRLQKLDETGTAHQHVMKVGVCINRGLIISQSAIDAGEMLLDDITAGALDQSSLNTDEDFHIVKRIQTTPGLGLQGSGSLGIPSELLFSRADDAGDYYFLDIAIDL